MTTVLIAVAVWLVISLLVGLLVGRHLGRAAAAGDERIRELGRHGLSEPGQYASAGTPGSESPSDDYVLGHRVHAVDGRRVYEVRR